MKRRIDRARLSALVVIVLVAVCASTASAVADLAPTLGRVLAAVAAAGAGALPLLRPRWSGTVLKDWTRARSVAEALKTDIYLWLAGAGPYRTDPDATQLREATDKLRVAAADLLPARQGIVAVSRSLPEVHHLTSYFDVRVSGQIEGYYEPKAAQIARRISLFRRIEIALGLVGLLLGAAAAATGSSLASWITVVTTVTAAVGVHVAATRYEFQLIEFSRTAQRLRLLRSRAFAPHATDRDRERLAVQAEDVISIENQGWMAKLAEDPTDHGEPEATV